MAKILVVEDNKAMLEMFTSILAEKGYEIKGAEDVSHALLLFKKENFDLIISDLQLPDMDGLNLFKRVKKSGVPFILITAYGSIEKAVEAIKEGVFDFISKPVDPEYLFIVIEKALESTRMLRENIFLKNLYFSEIKNTPIVGINKAFLKEGEKLKQVAITNTPVLLLGESGTGKELFARAIHNLSPRKDNPFIAVNSASIPENLLENELFGHEKGSFTDAHLKYTGKLEIAQGGTFFMDEIGDLPLNLQGKILRVIEEKKITRLGSIQEINLDIRFIFATNIDIETAVKESRFRKDLFYRINVFPLRIPPLRDRKDDITILADYFAKKISIEMGKGDIKITKNAKNKLINYKWPGNVRELQNTIERALILCKTDTIDASDVILPDQNDISIPDSFLTGDLKQSVSMAVKYVEKRKITEILNDTDFNKSKAAELLNISYKSLLEKIKKYEIKRED